VSCSTHVTRWKVNITCTRVGSRVSCENEAVVSRASRSCRRYALAAESLHERAAWVDALRAAIAAGDQLGASLDRFPSVPQLHTMQGDEALQGAVRERQGTAGTANGEAQETPPALVGCQCSRH
jgi:hypothetical protein